MSAPPRACRAVLATPLLALLVGCVNLHFERATVSEPITDSMLTKLKPGSSDVRACLTELGAPQIAFEQPSGRYALVWWWIDEFDWGFSISIPVTQGANASYRYSDIQLDQPGVLLLFDDRDVVQQIRRGRLSEFALERGATRLRPSVIED